MSALTLLPVCSWLVCHSLAHLCLLFTSLCVSHVPPVQSSFPSSFFPTFISCSFIIPPIRSAPFFLLSLHQLQLFFVVLLTCLSWCVISCFFLGFFLHVFDQPSRGRHRRPTHFSKSAWLSGSAATTCQEDVSVFFHDECRRMFTCCSLRHSLMCDRNTDVFLHAFCEISRLKARFQPPSPSWSSLRFYLWVSEPARLCVATCLLWPGNAVSPEQQDGP